MFRGVGSPYYVCISSKTSYICPARWNASLFQVYAAAVVVVSVGFGIPPCRAEEPPLSFSGAHLKASRQASVGQDTGKPLALDAYLSVAVCRACLAGFMDSAAFSQRSGLTSELYCMPPAGVTAQDVARVAHAYELAPDAARSSRRCAHRSIAAGPLSMPRAMTVPIDMSEISL